MNSFEVGNKHKIPDADAIDAPTLGVLVYMKLLIGSRKAFHDYRINMDFSYNSTRTNLKGCRLRFRSNNFNFTSSVRVASRRRDSNITFNILATFWLLLGF